jgi:hypothetical protein
MSEKLHPIQPLVMTDSGVLRFKKNAIVDFLLEAGPFDLNQLAVMDFSREDWEQFAQLIGYSHSGAFDLDYISREVLESAEIAHENGVSEIEARNQYLRETLQDIKMKMRDAVAALYGVHPDDLTDEP